MCFDLLQCPNVFTVPCVMLPKCWPRAIQHTTCANRFQVLVRVDIIRLKSMTVGATCLRHVQRLFPVGQLFCILPSVCQHVSPCYKTRHYLPFEFSSLDFRFMACTSRFFAENVRSQFECAVTLVRVHCEHPTSVWFSKVFDVSKPFFRVLSFCR